MGYIGAGPTRFNTADELTVTGDAEFNGDLTVKGTHITLDSATVQTVDLGDNDKIRLGDSDDLQIYHDGSASIIYDNGTGPLNLQTNNSNINIKGGGSASDTMAIFKSTEGVDLYYNNVKKFETTATGVDVTGTVTADGVESTCAAGDANQALLAYHPTSTSSRTIAKFQSNVGGTQQDKVVIKCDGSVDIFNSSGATLKLTSTDTTGANTETLGQIDFVSSDVSGGSAGTQARIKGVYEDNGDSSGIAFLTGNSTGSGSPTINEVMRIRHEGNVGIGTASPGELLHCSLPSGTNGDIVRLSRSAGAYSFQLGVSSGATSNLYISDGSNNKIIDFTSSGNVGIGISSPETLLHVNGSASGTLLDVVKLDNFQGATNTEVGMTFECGVDRIARISAKNEGSDVGPLKFWTAGTADTLTERMRIDSSGDLLIGATSTVNLGGINPKLIVQNGTDGMAVQEIGNGYIAYATKPSGAHNYYAGFFMNSSTTGVGSIFCTTSSTAYNTSSDYRLKENVTATWDATTRLKQLNPVRFNFIADADTTVDGFLAHEVQDVVPEAITGTKDAMRDEEYEVSAATGDIYTPAIEAVLDDDGNEVTPAVAEVIHSTDVERPEELTEGQQWRETTAAVMGTRSVPDYQGIDQSKLVPLLVKTIQELEARITALETA